MTLQAYRHHRLIVLNADTTALEAALAMRTNEVGAIVVTEDDAIVGIVTDRDLALRVVGADRSARTTSLGDVMSRDVATLPPEAAVREVIRLMKRRRIRRVPLMERGRVVGMVTLDDLILEKSAGMSEVNEVVRAQIIEGGPARTRRFDEWRSLERRYARALVTWRTLVGQLVVTSGLETREDAAQAIMLVLGTLVRRIEPALARRMMARLPVLVQARLRELPPGPDLSVTRASLERDLAETLGVKRSTAASIVDSIGALMAKTLDPSDSVGRRLPSDLRCIFRRRGTNTERGAGEHVRMRAARPIVRPPH